MEPGQQAHVKAALTLVALDQIKPCAPKKPPQAVELHKLLYSNPEQPKKAWGKKGCAQPKPLHCHKAVRKAARLIQPGK